MTIIVSLMILAYCIMGRDIRSLLEKVKDVDWKDKGKEIMEKIIRENGEYQSGEQI